MKQIIDGKTYNTETATVVGTVRSKGVLSYDDFRRYLATLYKTPKGRFFVFGEGGPMTIFARPCGNGTIGGSGFVALEPEEALELAESAGIDADTIAEHFGDLIEDA